LTAISSSGTSGWNGYTVINKTEALKMNVREVVPGHRLDETLASMKRLREGEEIRSYGKKACD
jgi:hypothetical protein